jgi:hypothetical protein
MPCKQVLTDLRAGHHVAKGGIEAFALATASSIASSLLVNEDETKLSVRALITRCTPQRSASFLKADIL